MRGASSVFSVLRSPFSVLRSHTSLTPHDRWNLRSTIEKRGLSINEEFLAASASAQQVFVGYCVVHSHQIGIVNS
ncbi:hypothetical protein ACS0TY_022289 [Phlomoides rotata]